MQEAVEGKRVKVLPFSFHRLLPVCYHISPDNHISTMGLHGADMDTYWTRPGLLLMDVLSLSWSNEY